MAKFRASGTAPSFWECDEHSLLHDPERVRPGSFHAFGSSPSGSHHSRNRIMVESLELFDSVVNSQWFSRTSIILFMTKVDLFREKLPKARLPIPAVSLS